MIPAIQLLDASAKLYGIGGLVKSSSNAVKSFSLAGTLQASDSGWILLSVPNALVRGAFDALHEAGAELPPNKSGKLNAHISVMRPDELKDIGGVDAITERGKQFHYAIDGVKTCEPEGWDEMSRVWFLSIKSPELENLRKSYGLSPRPKNNKFEFHITIGVRRKHVLRHNDVKKAEAEDNPYDELCPECGTPAVARCRCLLGNFYCKNKHSWHRCPVHKCINPGTGHGIDGCTCPDKKASALPELPEEFQSKSASNTLLPELPPEFAKEAMGGGHGEMNEKLRRLMIQLDVLDDVLYMRYFKNMQKLRQVSQDTNQPDLYQQGIEALKAGKFDIFSKLLDEKGSFTQTGHKRLAISDKIINQDTLDRLGFIKGKIAIPEEGQLSWDNWRHPDTLLHFHPHNGFFTVHQDNHPDIGSSLQKKNPDLFKTINQGVLHSLTEGMPGAFYFARNKLMNPIKAPPVDRANLGPNDKPLGGIVDRLFKESPTSLITTPGEKVVPIPTPPPTIKTAAKKEEYVPSVVKLSIRGGDQKICPRCGKKILHDLYKDKKGWQFHRSCFAKGEGRIKESFSFGDLNVIDSFDSMYNKALTWDKRLEPFREQLRQKKAPTLTDAENAIKTYSIGGKEVAKEPILGTTAGDVVGTMRGVPFIPQQIENFFMDSGLLSKSPERVNRVNKGLFDQKWIQDHYKNYTNPKTTDSWFLNHHIDRALRYGKENMFDKGLFKDREHQIINNNDGYEAKYNSLLKINPAAAKAFKDSMLAPDGEFVKIVGHGDIPSTPSKYFKSFGQYIPTINATLGYGGIGAAAGLASNLLGGSKQAARQDPYAMPGFPQREPFLHHLGRMAVRMQEPADVSLVDPNRPSAFENTPPPMLSRKAVVKPKLLLDLQNPFTAAKARELYDKLYPHHLEPATTRTNELPRNPKSS